MPLCSRCFGCYLGLFIGILFFLFFNIYLNKFVSLSIFLFFNLPLIIDWITQFFGFRKSYNLLRFITGFIGGIGMSTALVYLVSKIF